MYTFHYYRQVLHIIYLKTCCKLVFHSNHDPVVITIQLPYIPIVFLFLFFSFANHQSKMNLNQYFWPIQTSYVLIN